MLLRSARLPMESLPATSTKLDGDRVGSWEQSHSPYRDRWLVTFELTRASLAWVRVDAARETGAGIAQSADTICKPFVRVAVDGGCARTLATSMLCG